MGKSSINGPFSMAMLNNQRVPLNSSNIRRDFPCGTFMATPQQAPESKAIIKVEALGGYHGRNLGCLNDLSGKIDATNNSSGIGISYEDLLGFTRIYYRIYMDLLGFTSNPCH